MTAIAPSRAVPEFSFRIPKGIWTDEEFAEFCRQNPDLRTELTADKHIIVMPPTNSETGRQNAELSFEVAIWNRKHKLGFVFDSSTGFKIDSNATYSPDVSWIRRDRWEALSLEDRQKFAPITPDFVVEIRSGDQNMATLRAKMNEYIDSGCRLGWLINPNTRKTEVYTASGDIHTVSFDDLLSGGDVLPGFELRLNEIFG